MEVFVSEGVVTLEPDKKRVYLTDKNQITFNFYSWLSRRQGKRVTVQFYVFDEKDS